MNKKAFTLIESLVSVIILSICMAGGIHLYNYADNMTSLAIHKKVANEVINSSMEDLKSSDYFTITGTNNNTFVTTIINVGGLSATESINVVPVDDAGMPVAPGSESFKEITISFVWSEADDVTDDQRSHQIVTYIAK